WRRPLNRNLRRGREISSIGFVDVRQEASHVSERRARDRSDETSLFFGGLAELTGKVKSARFLSAYLATGGLRDAALAEQDDLIGTEEKDVTNLLADSVLEVLALVRVGDVGLATDDERALAVLGDFERGDRALAD